MKSVEVFIYQNEKKSSLDLKEQWKQTNSKLSINFVNLKQLRRLENEELVAFAQKIL